MAAVITARATSEPPSAHPARVATEPPDGFWYLVKCRVLGPPLVTGQLAGERLSRPLALGVLSCDGLSSAAYGTEEILYALLPFFGLAAFTLVLPLTLVVLFGVLLVVLSYREVVSVYTRAGGSYVVARENFGPRVAQVAAVALLIDYVVTVAVQTAAGSAAIVSAFPALSRIPVIGPRILLVISVAAIGVMCLGNLRGIREAGRVFALPTYLFAGSLLVMVAAGLVRELTGGLPRIVPATGAVGIGSHSGLIAVGAVYVMAKAFANGGSSLTGIEAVSNAVSALRPPEGRHARQILATQGTIVAILIAGISWLAHVTHAIPYTAGFPTVLAQEASAVFGHSTAGQVMFFVVQAATAAILFTGGNTSFTGFPFLASFVAEDSFLPRWLGRRGHRLAFSNGIILLAALSVSLMLVAGATVDALIPFYAIGVFTGFAMAGFGMARYHRRTREPGWRRRLVINMAGGVYTALVVLLFAVVKFTEGAWLIVIVFPVLVFALIRLNGEYRPRPRASQNPATTPRARSRRTSPAALCCCLPTTTTWQPSRRSGTQGACGPPCCARFTSTWTARGLTGCARNGCRPAPGSRLSWPTARTAASPTRQPGWPPRLPPILARTSPWCCRAAATRRLPGGCCTITPRTGSPAWSAGFITPPPRSSPTTWGTKWNGNGRGGSGRPRRRGRAGLNPTSAPHRHQEPTRSGRWASPVTPPSRAACARPRSGPAGRPGPACWRARSPTRPES